MLYHVQLISTFISYLERLKKRRNFFLHTGRESTRLTHSSLKFLHNLHFYSCPQGFILCINKMVFLYPTKQVWLIEKNIIFSLFWKVYMYLLAPFHVDIFFFVRKKRAKLFPINFLPIYRFYSRFKDERIISLCFCA